MLTRQPTRPDAGTFASKQPLSLAAQPYSALYTGVFTDQATVRAYIGTFHPHVGNPYSPEILRAQLLRLESSAITAGTALDFQECLRLLQLVLLLSDPMLTSAVGAGGSSFSAAGPRILALRHARTLQSGAAVAALPGMLRCMYGTAQLLRSLRAGVA